MHVNATKLQNLQKELTSLANQKKAQIGIAVIINSKDTIKVNNEYRYPLMSVYKFHQSLAIAHLMEERHTALDSMLFISKKELLENTYSPLRDTYPNTDLTLTIRELLQYTLLLSDNNACDILFHHLLEVSQTNKYFHSLGIKDIAITATEEQMRKQPNLCYSNWSSPLASVKLLELLLNNKLINGDYKDFIIHTMLQCKTGPNRLPGFDYPEGVKIGHKTGTGGKNNKGEIIGVNDIGFILLPDGQHYTIAVLIKNSKESLKDTEEIIATISNIVYSWVSQK